MPRVVKGRRSLTGFTLRARSVAAQERDCLLKVLTYDLMILGAAADPFSRAS
jgi:hypothetical protein